MLLKIKTFLSSLNYSWLNFKLQTQVIFATTILVFVLTSNLTSWPLKNIEIEINRNNIRFENDINSLLSTNIVLLLKEKKESQINQLCERFYQSSPNIRCILFIDREGLEYGLPYDYSELRQIFLINETADEQKSQRVLRQTQRVSPVRIVKLTLMEQNDFLGLLIIGNNLTPNSFKQFTITNEIIILLCFNFGIVLIIGAVYTKLAITNPIREVTTGIESITHGDFNKRIRFLLGGEVGELITKFNELGRQLKLNEEQTLSKLWTEKIKFESIVTTIDDGTLLLDINLRIILVNRAASKFLGWKKNTRILGSPIWDHLPRPLQKKLFVTLQAIIFEKNIAVFEEILTSDIYDHQYIRIIVNIVYDDELQTVPIGVGLTIQDTTKEVELDKTQSRFMSNISHELRTPLFNIKSFIETLQEYDYTLSIWQKRYFLDIVNQETNRLTRLVNDILCISKLEAKGNVTLENINLLEIIDQTISTYQIIAREKKLKLDTKHLLPLTTIRGNKDLLLQVLINLIGNALKFTYPNGEIIIRTYITSQYKLRIEIADTGIGILENHQQTIFQQFYRVENDVHTLKGTGLGLSIVQTILAEHNTTIHVISRYNTGSIFWFDVEQI